MTPTDSIFSKIIRGEVPAYKIAENDQFFSFLDINPVAKGHTLVVPKQQIDYYFELPDELYGPLWQFTRRVADALEATIPCQRIGVTILGLEVPHAHVHLVPLDDRGVIDFRTKVKFTPEEFNTIAADIRSNL